MALWGNLLKPNVWSDAAMDARKRKGYAWAFSAGLTAALAAISAKLFTSQVHSPFSFSNIGPLLHLLSHTYAEDPLRSLIFFHYLQYPSYSVTYLCSISLDFTLISIYGQRIGNIVHVCETIQQTWSEQQEQIWEITLIFFVYLFMIYWFRSCLTCIDI